MLKESISQTVWDLKYRYRLNGSSIDQSIEDTWLRVAKAVAQAEKGQVREQWQRAYYGILEGFQFLPGGRILAGAGTSYQATLFNCFVMNIAEDSLRGIFDALEEGALTLQQGGGVGYDFSILRPEGDVVQKTGLPATGPVSFMRIWDTMCSIMLSTGARRGAMMGVLRCDHPDIETFIAAKADKTQLRHFNVSVMVSDAFMQAVKDDADWSLVFQGKVYRHVKARALWRDIIRAAYDYAEPGVLFGDTINRNNNLWYREIIHATNPCGEIPLPAYGACNLGALNLTQFVQAPFTSAAKINWTALENVVRIATRFQDDVIDVSRYPLAAQREQAEGTRRIGLGVTGLGDMFVMLGLRYGSAESLRLAAELMKRVANVTWQTSIELAREKGKFPFYAADYLRGAFVQKLDDNIQQDLTKYGVRNSHHNTIAPAGTISLLANNISNGIEPIFKSEYIRHMRSIKSEMLTFRVRDYAHVLWQESKNTGEKAPAWEDTETLTPTAHLAVQSAVQPFIDNAVSKTINIPTNFPLEKLADVYTRAYEMGLKGCTVFRPNEITGSILELINEEPPASQCCSFEE